MKWSDIADFAASVAPVLGMALGGPLGAKAGAMLGTALGVEEKTPQAILAALQKDPQAMERLAKFEAEQALELAKMAIADKQNARAREVYIAQATGSRDWFMAALGGGLAIGYTVITAYSVWTSPPGELSSAAVSLVSTYGAGFISVIGYYFGSSAGSARKDEAMKFSK